MVIGTAEPSRDDVMVVGSGWRFTSGISYYTCHVVNALATRHRVSVLLARRLVPRFLYPGRRRVGVTVNELDYADGVARSETLDWFWGLGMVRSLSFLARRRPNTLLLQWWTGATLHTYLLLALFARRRGSAVVIEWHEVQDTGEARIPGVTRYVRWLMGRLLAMTDGHVVHSAFDLAALRSAYDIAGPVVVVPHGPYDHVRSADTRGPRVGDAQPGPPAAATASRKNLLYFGVVRPYKGVEDLVQAFDELPEDVAQDVHLTIAGETWEGCTAHREAVAASRYAGRITVLDRYFTDAEVSELFAAAAAVALPYRRSSSSGPLHLAMSAGLPVLVTDVGGLRTAAEGYQGAVFVPSGDRAAMTSGLIELIDRCGRTYQDVRSWAETLDAYDGLMCAVRGGDGVADAEAPAVARAVVP